MVPAQALADGDPRELGPYRLAGRLGRGGMGTVFLAERPAGPRVAIKVINPELAQEEAFRERFRREVTAARRVRPFCTAPVLDADLTGDPLYVVTEYIDGPTLAEAVRRDGPLAGSNLEGLAVGMATALSAIHNAGVVHRDLKPSNVLLSVYGPRVIDFGIARALDTLGGGTTGTGQLVGTPAYMAPELLNGGEITPAADIFCWACVLAFAATGRPPYSGRTLQELLYRVASEPPRLDGLTGPLRELAEAATARNPAERPSAPELLNRLTGQRDPAAIDGATLVAPTMPDQPRPSAPAEAPPAPPASPTPSGPPVLGAAAKRRRLLLLAAGGAAVVVTAPVVILILSNDESGGTGRATPTPTGPPGLRRTIVSDDFADSASGWPDGYRDEIYHVAGTDLDTAAAAPVRAQLPANIMLDVKVRFTAGEYQPDSQAGVYCRNGYGGAKYTLGIRPDGVARVRKLSLAGSKQLGRSATSVGTAGQWNRLQATCTDEAGKVRLRLWVNGRPAVDVLDADNPYPNDARFYQYATGLYVLNPGAGKGTTGADFDDFVLGEI